jgi:CRP-like cAMP-binding protein
MRQVSLQRGTVCFEAGQLIDRVYFPLTGMISLFVTTGDGEMIETGTIGREHYTEVLWAESQQIAACYAAHSSSARLCRRLLQAADSIGCDHMPLTHEYLATMIGARRTTVTLLALELQELGAIKCSRGKIAILDRSALEACACECYQSMTQHNLNLTLKMGLTF